MNFELNNSNWLVICVSLFICQSYDLGLNKDFKKMLNENAEFKALTQKEIRTASDGTRKVKLVFLCSVFTFFII